MTILLRTLQRRPARRLLCNSWLSERINDDGKVRYELEGNLIKEKFEFLISEEGILIEMELEDD